MKRTTSQILWLALARECLVNAGDSAAQAEATVGVTMDDLHLARIRVNKAAQKRARALAATLPLEPAR